MTTVLKSEKREFQEDPNNDYGIYYVQTRT
jgi:hypothetical protein